jgi:calcium/calmodulin-dependent protein kinase (CaM kinase) II
MAASVESELLDLSAQLLDSIGEKDWETYSQLCDVSLTCFEPEAVGQLVEGLEFHKFYFDLEGAPAKRNTTLASPHVRLLGQDAAVVSYIRLIQKLDGNGVPITVSVEETRVWQRVNGRWKHVHFHRSAPTK